MGEWQIAFLRGVNVGRARRVPMADLRVLVAGFGYTDVRTVLNSGNVVFRATPGKRRGAAGRIERAMVDRLGVTARVTVLSGSEVAAAVAGNPLGSRAGDPARFLVAIPATAEDLARLAPLAGRDWTPEAFGLGTRVAYLWCADGILDSPLAKEVGRVLGDGVTMRNWATMTKLCALATPDGGV